MKNLTTLFKITRGEVTATVKADLDKRLYVNYKNNSDGSIPEYECFKKEIDMIHAKISVGFCQGYEKRYKDGKALNGKSYTLWSY